MFERNNIRISVKEGGCSVTGQQTGGHRLSIYNTSSSYLCLLRPFFFVFAFTAAVPAIAIIAVAVQLFIGHLTFSTVGLSLH
jgi:hypothetical protein